MLVKKKKEMRSSNENNHCVTYDNREYLKADEPADIVLIRETQHFYIDIILFFFFFFSFQNLLSGFYHMVDDGCKITVCVCVCTGALVCL